MDVKGIVLVAVVAVVLGGCREERDDAAGEPESPTTAEEVRKEVDEAVGAATEYLGQKKDEFVARAEKEMGELEGRFEGLKERSSEAATESSRKLEDLRVEVDKRLERAREELGDLRQAGGETWRRAAAEFGEAMKDLREAYDDYMRAYRSEREPQTQPDTGRG
jgi:flagellar motor switch/type III secretory pathway protein FliN